MSLFIPDNDFADTSPIMPAGLGKQGRYRTRQPGDVARRIGDADYAATYHGDGIVRHRSGHPIADMAQLDDDDEPLQPGDNLLTVLMWTLSIGLVGTAAWHLIAVLRQIIARWLA